VWEAVEASGCFPLLLGFSQGRAPTDSRGFPRRLLEGGFWDECGESLLCLWWLLGWLSPSLIGLFLAFFHACKESIGKNYKLVNKDKIFIFFIFPDKITYKKSH
jgi:hypothetical protein